MTSATAAESVAVPAAQHTPRRFGPSATLVLLLFLAYSGFCRPVPSVNEPHYLTKARHYWQPQWCAGDFFLDSANPHRVFYQTVGALTQWLTLEQSAWIGRLIALALLAWGWTRLVSRISPQNGVVPGSACLFLLLQSLGNFSGEWLVGGVESKVIAYALAFAGWASLLEGRFAAAGIGLGLAVSFHPVVGGWCVIATAMALLADRWRTSAREQGAALSPAPAGRVIGLVLLIACALPGLGPALQSLIGADPEMAALADRYQVGVRLPHHLDPMAIPLAAYRYYGLLLILWLLLRDPATNTPQRRLFVRIVLAALVIAGVGIVVGWGPRPLQRMPLAELRVWLLKFYSFRLADVLIPLLLSVVIYERVCGWASRRSGWRSLSGGLVATAALLLALWMPGADKSSSRMTAPQEADWRAACEWIRAQTPADALLYAANEDWAVKWFTHRAEYVNYKDCPQDAAGILEWVRRLKLLNRWHQGAFRDARISTDELRQLHEQTGITHLLVSRLGPIDAEPVYRNDSFRVYAIAPAQRSR